MPDFLLSPGQNPRAPGQMSYGVEGEPPGFTVTTDGVVTIGASLTVAGTPVTGGGTGQVGYFPPEGYGCFALSGTPESLPATGFSSGDFFTARIWVPADKEIVRVATAVNVAGTWNGSSSPNQFYVYEDDGTGLHTSPDDPTLWTAVGWRSGVLSTPIAAQSSGRFVRAGFTIAGVSGAAWPLSAGSNMGNTINGGVGVTNVRFAYRAGVTTPPATIDPTTNPSGFGTLIGLADA